jgi:hypothetical protein
MPTYCLECGKKLTGHDLEWMKTHDELICNGGDVEDYCICQECIDSRLQEDFDETCNQILGRGGPRPGSGRKPMNPELKKQKKAFSLSPESVQALADLQESLGLGSQSAVVEFLVLKASRELVGADRALVERQLDLF